jgi:hypothetical protein
MAMPISGPLKLIFIAIYNIRSSKQDSEKNMVLCKKGDDITSFDGTQKSKIQETALSESRNGRNSFHLYRYRCDGRDDCPDGDDESHFPCGTEACKGKTIIFK